VADDLEAPHAAFGAFLRAVEDLRDDVREDNRRLEERVMGAVSDLRREQRESVEAHSKAHLTDAIATETQFGRINDFMRNAELAQARKDGALGVFRFVVEQVSRHWAPLVAVLAAMAGSALAIAGNIRIELGVR
jgi:hypothetical protein